MPLGVAARLAPQLPVTPPAFPWHKFPSPKLSLEEGWGRQELKPALASGHRPAWKRHRAGAPWGGAGGPSGAEPYLGGEGQRSQQHLEPGCRDAAAQGRRALAVVPSPRRRAKLNSKRDFAGFLSPPGFQPQGSPPRPPLRSPCRCHCPARAAGQSTDRSGVSLLHAAGTPEVPVGGGGAAQPVPGAPRPAEPPV